MEVRDHKPFEARWSRRRVGRAVGATIVALVAGSAVGLGLLVWALPAAADAASPRLPAGVVPIRSHRCDGALSGLGVITGDGRVITAAHVIGGADRVAVGTRPATPFLQSFDADVAVGTTDALGGLAVGLDPSVAESVSVVDRKRGGWRRGVIVSVGTTSAGAAIELSLAGAPGDSGGPVIDDDGAIVGIVVAVGPDDRLRALPISTVIHALDGPLLRPPGTRCGPLVAASDIESDQESDLGGRWSSGSARASVTTEPSGG